MNFGVDFRLMIVIVRHRRVRFDRLQMIMVTAHFVRRPAVGKIVHHDLGYSNAGQPTQVGRLAFDLFNVRAGYGCHGDLSKKVVT